MKHQTFLGAALAIAAFLSLPPIAHAAPRSQVVTCGRFGCSDNPGAASQASARATARYRTGRHSRQAGKAHGRASVAETRLGGRPANCPTLWCGCWLAQHLAKRLGLSGKEARRLWVARNWATIGHRISGPEPGAIAIYARGRRGGHVGEVTSVVGPGRIILLSGNDGGAVRERERSTAGVIAWVRL